MPQKIAAAVILSIGAVFHIGYMMHVQIRVDFTSGCHQNGPYNSVTPRWNPAEPLGSRTAGKVQKHSFRKVIRMMSSCDHIRTAGLPCLLQKRIPQGAGRLFDA